MLCPFCGHPNESKAKVCILCKHSLAKHRSRWKRLAVLIVLTIILMGTLYTMNRLSGEIELAQGQTKIELLNSAGYRTRTSVMIVEGKIRNLSGEKLIGVYAVASWYSKDNKLLDRERNMIRKDPLLNTQVSTFTVKLPYKEGMEHYDLAFETKDGTPLLTVDRRGRQTDNDLFR